VSRQIVAIALIELLTDPDAGRSRLALEELLCRKKIEIAALRCAIAG